MYETHLNINRLCNADKEIAQRERKLLLRVLPFGIRETLEMKRIRIVDDTRTIT